MRHILTVIMIQICLTTFGQVNIKEVDKSLAKINDNLYASKYEVSNSQYVAFILSLKKEKQTGKLAIAQIDSSKWLDKLGYNKPFVSNYHTHAAYKDYPVVNIRQEAAIMFCEWLTNEYNSNPNRKFKKVKFRLPTEQEWMIAAQGGDNSATYPWDGNELKNKKGQYMCNFAITNDGGTEVSVNLKNSIKFPTSVKSYFPNKFNIYNLSGNIAEMLADNTIVKGGSWLDSSEFMKIISKQNYDGSAKNSIGFRYFLDVIEK